jgi:curved DNA-binding protein CbpA
MTKNYYKILGVKEDASGKEIRGRYVELAKRYHPDLKKSAEGSDKIKEINEAYEVLKDDPTRMDYDLRMSLKRAYLKKRGKGKERSWLTKKAVFPMSILFVLIIIFSLFLWKRPVVHVQSSSMTYHPIANSIRNSSGALNPAGIIQKSNPAIGGTAAADPGSAPERLLSEPEALLSRRLPRREGLWPGGSSGGIVSDGVKMVGDNPAPHIQARQPEPEAQVREVISKTSPTVHQEKPRDIQINSMATAAVSKEVIPSEPPKEIEQQLPSAPEKAKPDPIIHPPPLTSKQEPPINVTLSSPPLLVEEEVRQFLGRYIERYVRKDIDAFLALFSSKAIQNGKDGPEKIREIYVRFFDQSEELAYRLDDIKVSINGNEAEVMVRYQVTQRLKKLAEERLWKGNIRWVLVKEDGVLRIITLDFQNDKSP